MRAKSITYKGRASKPCRRHVVGFKPVRQPLYTLEIKAACDHFWKRTCNLGPIGNMKICEHIGDMQLCES